LKYRRLRGDMLCTTQCITMWCWPLTSWPQSCPSHPVDHFCQLASKSVHMLFKFVFTSLVTDERSNERTDEQTNRLKTLCHRRCLWHGGILSCLDEWLADLLMEYHANGRWWCVTACDVRQAVRQALACQADFWRQLGSPRFKMATAMSKHRRLILICQLRTKERSNNYNVKLS